MTPSRLLILSKPSRPPAAILSQFASGEAGDIWLPHFTKYAFQDAGMTIPAVVGSPVVKMVGLARGVVATFSNVTLQQDGNGKKYLASDGSTSSGQTTAIDFSGTDEMMIVAGVRKGSDAAAAMLCELTANAGSTSGAFFMTAPGSASPSYGLFSRGDVAPAGSINASGYAAPTTNVVTGLCKISTPEFTLRVDGVQKATSNASQGAGNYSNAALYFFKRGGLSLPFNGGLYGLMARGKYGAAGQVADTERIMAGYTGVNL